jgi:hypothetical protein
VLLFAVAIACEGLLRRTPSFAALLIATLSATNHLPTPERAPPLEILRRTGEEPSR